MRVCVSAHAQMAQEDPLYDFPEPARSPSATRRDVHRRAQGSMRSVSVLDRLLLTLPVWLQLSVNPATALHILQREPPGVRVTRIDTHALQLKWISAASLTCMHYVSFPISSL